LIKEIYLLTKTCPKNETHGLVSQLRRVAISISSNLAEGASRKTKKDQARCSAMAYGSLMEKVD
jgi:four helix bundle protein